MAQNFVDALNASEEYNIQVPEEFAVTQGRRATKIPYGNQITLRSTLCAQPKYGWRYTIRSRMSAALGELLAFYNPSTSSTASIRYVLASNMLHEMCAGINPELMYLMKCVPRDEKAFDSVNVAGLATELSVSTKDVKDILVSVRHSLDRVTDLQREILWNYEQTLKTSVVSTATGTGAGTGAGNAAMFSALTGASSLLTI